MEEKAVNLLKEEIERLKFEVKKAEHDLTLQVAKLDQLRSVVYTTTNRLEKIVSLMEEKAK